MWPHFPATLPAMFYACLSILILLMVMLVCVCLSIIDLEAYNFGLYIVLLCIVGKKEERKGSYVICNMCPMFTKTLGD